MLFRSTAYFLRRLWEYFANPPATGYITWNPKDRIDRAYNIEIEGLQVGGQDIVSFDYLALRHGLVVGEVVFTFRIVGGPDAAFNRGHGSRLGRRPQAASLPDSGL